MVLNIFVCTAMCTIVAINYFVFQDEMKTFGNNIWRLRKQLGFVQVHSCFKIYCCPICDYDTHIWIEFTKKVRMKIIISDCNVFCYTLIVI